MAFDGKRRVGEPFYKLLRTLLGDISRLDPKVPDLHCTGLKTTSNVRF